MGSYHGECPKCNQMISFRDEYTDWATFLEEEYQRGYFDGVEDKKRADSADERIAAMENLLAANCRVLRKEIESSTLQERTV